MKESQEDSQYEYNISNDAGNDSAPNGSRPPQESINKTAEPQTVEEKKSHGPAVAIVLILLVLGLGAVYALNIVKKNMAINNEGAVSEKSVEEINTEPDPQLKALQNASTSDSIESIEGDLNDTSLDNIDVEVKNIDAELGF